MGSIADARDPQSLSGRFRARRDLILRAMVERCRAGQPASLRAGPFRIVDLGGTADYWRRVGFDWLDANDIRITCVNLFASEFGDDQHPRIECIVGDVTNMAGHADNSFDFVHSNSVVEHVGQWRQMRAFATEVRRLAPSYYVQTPNFWFPVDPHFYRLPMFHWLPARLRVALLRRFKIGWARPTGELDHAMQILDGTILIDRTQMRALFPDARIINERLGGLAKSLIAVREESANAS